MSMSLPYKGELIVNSLLMYDLHTKTIQFLVLTAVYTDVTTTQNKICNISITLESSLLPFPVNPDTHPEATTF